MNANELRSILVSIAEGEVGTREEGGNNRGARVRTYQSATWLEPAAWPWCAAFLCWAVREWLLFPGVAEAMKISNVEEWRPKTAGAFDFARWAAKRKLPILGEQAAVQASDLVIFDFSHIGIVVDDARASSRTISTVEGNTNNAGQRDSESGDGVWRKVRARGLVKEFIRLC